MYINYWSGGTKLYEGKTTGIHNLKLMDYLQNTQIPLAPMAMQKQFEAIARQSDKSKFELQKALDELTAMQKKLMLNIFSEQ
jgi:type I restriction enzyme S subunit